MAKTNKMTLVPVLIIVALILGAGYMLISGDIKLPWMRNDNTLEIRRLEGFPTSVAAGTPTPKMREVVTNQKDLETFLKAVDSTGNLALGEKINFDREYLLAASDQTEGNDGYALKIKKVYIDKKNDSLLVSINLQQPGETCAANEVLTTPVDIVAIGKTDKKINFEIVRETKICN